MTDTDTRTAIELDENTALWLKAAEHAKAQIEHWQEIHDRALEQVKAAAGDAEDILVDGCLVARYSFVETSRIDTKKMAAEHPALVDSYRVPTSHRRFTFTGSK